MFCPKPAIFHPSPLHSDQAGNKIDSLYEWLYICGFIIKSLQKAWQKWAIKFCSMKGVLFVIFSYTKPINIYLIKYENQGQIIV